MTTRGFFLVFVMSAAAAFGQLDSNSITVTASRSSTIQPDQVAITLDVTAGLSSSLDDVIAALQSLGVTLGNFRNVNQNLIFVSAPPIIEPPVDWGFTITVPIAKLKDTITALTALQKTITQNKSGMTLSFSVSGLQISSQLAQAQTCSSSDLLSDARTQAQTLASAANLFLGTVLAMSAATPPVIPSFGTTSTCSLTVKFAVTRLN